MKFSKNVSSAVFSIKVAVILGVAVGVSACGSGGGGSNGSGGQGLSNAAASVDSQGNCAANFVSDYNAVLSEVQMLGFKLKDPSRTEAGIKEQIQSMDGACKKFFAAHGSVPSCTAEVKYKIQSVSPADLKPGCDKAAETLAPQPQPQPEAQVAAPSTKPAAAAAETTPSEIKQTYDDKDVLELKPEEITITVTNEQKFRQLIDSAETNTIIIGGRSGTLEDEKHRVLDGEAFCFFTAHDTAELRAKVKRGETYAAFQIKDQAPRPDRRLVVIYLSHGFKVQGALGVMKASDKPIMVRDLRGALKGVAEVSVSIAE